MNKTIKYEKPDWNTAMDFAVIFIFCLFLAMTENLILQVLGICFGAYLGYIGSDFFSYKTTQALNYLKENQYQETKLRTKDTSAIIYEKQGSYFKALIENAHFRIIQVDKADCI